MNVLIALLLFTWFTYFYYKILVQQKCKMSKGLLVVWDLVELANVIISNHRSSEGGGGGSLIMLLILHVMQWDHVHFAGDVISVYWNLISITCAQIITLGFPLKQSSSTHRRVKLFSLAQEVFEHSTIKELTRHRNS